jgi:hypothetical protein
MFLRYDRKYDLRYNLQYDIKYGIRYDLVVMHFIDLVGH